MVSRRSHNRSSDSGSTLVEFAIGLPIFILLMAGLADAVTLGYNRVTMVYAAHEGLRRGIEGTSASDYDERAISGVQNAARLFGLNLEEGATTTEKKYRGELGAFLQVRVSQTIPLMVLPTSTMNVNVEGRLDLAS